MAKSGKAEIENRVTTLYHLLMQQTTYKAICQYASQTWEVTDRQTARYLEKAKQLMAKEFAAVRREAFNEQIAVQRNLFRNAYNERNWWLCLDILKDQARLLGCYPAKVSELEVVRQLTEAEVLPLEALERISTASG